MPQLRHQDRRHARLLGRQRRRAGHAADRHLHRRQRRRAHSCALRTDGTLACWGLNVDGQATPPAGTYTAVSAGAVHSCALRTDGTLACWGLNASVGVAPSVPGPVPPTGLRGVPYSFGFSSGRGVPAGVFSVAEGSLPPGLSLSGDGRLAGSPSVVGVFTFTVRVDNGLHPSAQRQFTMVVEDPAGPGGGWSAGSVRGDFNGDGAADLAVGVPGEDVGPLVDAGRVQVLYGGRAGLGAPGDQLWTQDSVGVGDVVEAGDRFGAALAVGDVNGDGRSDLAVGAPGEDVGAAVDAGVVHVLYGSAGGLRAAGSQLWSQDSAGIGDTVEVGDGFGTAVAIGNLGHGARGDLVVGVPGENLTGADNAGMVHAIYGGSGGLRAVGSQVWSQNNARIADTAETGDRFGAALATGDLTGRDRLDDVAIAAPSETFAGKSQAGVVHVLKATRTGLSATASQVWSQDRAGVADTAEAGDRFGSVLAAGDLGNGAHADLVVGVPDEDLPAIPDAGAVHVLYGGNGGLRSAASQLWTQNSTAVADTAETGDRFGAALGVGNLGRTGQADLVVGVPGEDHAAHRNAGIVHVLYATPTGVAAAGSQRWSQDTPGIAETGEAGDRFGAALAIANFNRAGPADLAVGVPGEDLATIADTGLMHTIHATTTGLATAGNRLYHQNTPGILGTNEPGNAFATTLGH